jgi:hypothetical protein
LAESGELKRRPPRHRKGEAWPSWRLEKEIKAITIIAIVSSKKPAGTIRLPFKMSVLADATYFECINIETALSIGDRGQSPRNLLIHMV